MRSVLALTLILAASSPVQASLVFPTGFQVSNGWTFHRCEQYSSFNPDVTVCVDGTAYYGQNTATGQWGATYDFWSSMMGTVPNDGSTVSGRMVGLAFNGTDPVYGTLTLVTIGSVWSWWGPAITSGFFFSPALTETSSLVSTQASFTGFDRAHSCCNDERNGPVTVTSMHTTTTPEPGSIAMLGSGLLALVGFRWRRRHT